MVTIVKIPAGDTAAEDQIIGPEAQLRMDSSRREVRLHDGVTPGGHRLPNIETLQQIFLQRNEGLGEEVGFPETGVGMLVRVDDTPTFVVRVLSAGDGVSISNTDGVADDPVISIDSTWLTAQLTALTATIAQLRSATAGKRVNVDVAFSANASVELTYNATRTFDFSTGWNFHSTLTGDMELSTVTNVKKQSGIIELTANGADRNVTLGGNWNDASGQFPIVLPDSETVYISYFVNQAGAPTILGLAGI